MKATKVQVLQDSYGTRLPRVILDFKDEGESPTGIAVGAFLIRATGMPVLPDGRWVTIEEARLIAHQLGADLVES